MFLFTSRPGDPLTKGSAGERLTPSHAVKDGRRYRYYISRALMAEAGSDGKQGWRLRH